MIKTTTNFVKLSIIPQPLCCEVSFTFPLKNYTCPSPSVYFPGLGTLLVIKFQRVYKRCTRTIYYLDVQPASSDLFFIHPLAHLHKTQTQTTWNKNKILQTSELSSICEGKRCKLPFWVDTPPSTLGTFFCQMKGDPTCLLF